jgi:hypothetical protein
MPAELDRGLEALLGRGPDQYGPPSVARTSGAVPPPGLYPAQYVVFRDHCESTPDGLRLVRREVLAAAGSLPALDRSVGAVPEQERASLCVADVENAESSCD